MFSKRAFLIAALAIVFFAVGEQESVLAAGINCQCYSAGTKVSEASTSSESNCNTACGNSGMGINGYKYNDGSLMPVGVASLGANNCFCYNGLFQTADSRAHVTSESTCNIACANSDKINHKYYLYGDALTPTRIGSKLCLLSMENIGVGAVAKALIYGGTVQTVDGGLLPSEQACINACTNGGYKSYNYDGSVIYLMHNCPAAPTTPTGGTTSVADGITSTKIPGTSVDPNSGIVSCGRPGQDMCTICDLIKGMNIVIQYLMKIAIGMALLAMGIGGVMYIVSAGDSGLIDKAKSTMKNAAVGFVIIFAGFLIINTTINYIGAKKNAAGEATFGMNITSWGNFDCAAKAR